MRRILVAVDGSGHALEAVRYVVALVRDGRPSEVHLVHVQPPLTGDVTAFVPHDVVRDFHMDEARSAMRSAREMFDRALVPYAVHIYVGYAAPVIAECARDLRCSLVVMGTHGFGKITHWLVGSVTRETVHLIDPMIPVTLVKAGRTQAQPPRSPALWRPA
jgi:nucleotide-binding universal stress UspA family protein